MRLLVILITSITFLPVKSQNLEDDEVRFKSAIDWLDTKLNYIYYDDVGEKWWTNTFYVNENKEVTLKHIASKNPNTANIRNKTYTIRTFQIQNINPESLKISDVKKTKGRIVKGKMLELRTFGFQNLIHKTINGKRASSTSFLYLSFPRVLEDSISNYAEIVKEKFQEAIISSTQIYPFGDSRDIATIFSCLQGNFISVNGEPMTITEKIQGVYKIKNAADHIQYFGFNNEREQFYLLKINSNGTETMFFDLDRNTQLSLQLDGLEVFSFHTLNSFSFNGLKFYRK
ncbi:hypothetical protein [Ekhidna sp.]|uniref:hypothetical protein n=1 Tax=Ekhidna sp. TaxID=2608089 RepID=UPI003BAA9BCD